MKTLLSTAAAFALAACASQEPQPVQVAQAECKVVPITTQGSTGNPPKHMTELQQRFAQADLASSQFRYQQLRREGMYPNNVEEALRDCY
ncbi:MAG TPA: hypothetical protein VH301_03685 [Usitatibacter sp.]|jgi:hypothetical protein|nr:hypothetical protein [Usitatibacter sp.]